MLQCFGELRIGAVMWVGLKVPVDKSGKRGSVKFNCRGCVVTESQGGEGGGRCSGGCAGCAEKVEELAAGMDP